MTPRSSVVFGEQTPLRQVSSITVTTRQYQALKTHERFREVLNFTKDNEVIAKRGFTLLQARNTSFLVWPLPLIGKTKKTSSIHIDGGKEGKEYTLQSSSGFFTPQPYGTAILVGCYCNSGVEASDWCPRFADEGPDGCTGKEKCCGLDIDLISVKGIVQVESF